MEFVDYKCLESLLIEGEDLIATEGLGSAISNAFYALFAAVKKFIGIVITICRTLIRFIHKAISSAVHLVTGKSEQKQLKGSDVTNVFDYATFLMTDIQTVVNAVFVKPEMDFMSLKMKIDNMRRNEALMINNTNKLLREYKGKKYTVNVDDADKWIDKLNTLLNKYENAYNKMNSLAESSKNEYDRNVQSGNTATADVLKNINSLSSQLTSIISEGLKSLNSAKDIIIGGTYVYTKDVEGLDKDKS